MRINKIDIIDVSTETVAEAGVYCVKDKKSPGFKAKAEWFKDKINKGLKMKIAVDKQGKQLGFIEYIPSEIAWRPVKAKNYLFVQCIGVFNKDTRNKKIGTSLLKQCESDALRQKKSGVCVLTSDGPWLANKKLFEKNGYELADKLERFELMYKKFNHHNPVPVFIDWKKQQPNYTGWNLIYSDQCPWHEKSVAELSRITKEKGIKLKITKIINPKQAQKSTSGFGTFSLIKDGKLLGDHYLSGTRFRNILKEE
jgi:hypothetical protein